MKTRVKFKGSSSFFKEWKDGDCGYIDDYLMDGEGRAFAVVVKDDGRIVLAYLSVLEVIWPSTSL